MKKAYQPTMHRCRFDFEVGYLVKSPCRGCKTRKRFPKCIDECKTLDRLHQMMSESVSCAKNR